MGGVDGEIVSALGDYGVSAKIIDSSSAETSGSPVIITYDDWYKWDLAQYLWTLDIYYKDSEMKPFAQANFKHDGLFHAFPDRRKVVGQLIDEIMLKLGVPKK